ncbi:MAG TPA: hypothetical protein VLX92_01440 [Kofleriaceae bacterium]|nr:hypothetical protein [Kofleriaceae bacterium]
MNRLAIACLFVSAPAFADVAGELSAGAGKDSSSDGYASAQADLTLALERAPIPPERRGLVLPCGCDGLGHAWVFTDADPDDRNGVRAQLDGLVHASEGATTLIGSARLAARGYGWELELGTAFQPTGDLRAVFWRSGRDVLATRFGFAMPPMVSYQTRDGRVEIAGMRFDYTGRTLHEDGRSYDGGDDFAIAFELAKWRARSHTLDILDVHVTGFGIADSYDETTQTSTGTSASDAAFDVVGYHWHVTPTIETSARFGFDQLAPTAPYVEVDNMPTAQPPMVMAARYWLELAQHDGDRTLHLGAGSWGRLDPSGYAADVGTLATAGFDWQSAKHALRLASELEVGRLRRALITPGAPSDLAPVGTRMWMGRGTLEADVRVTGGLAVASSAWLERSDRDDPRWAVPASGALATHAGADVSARWRFGHLFY